jgi:hypothetical protein
VNPIVRGLLVRLPKAGTVWPDKKIALAYDEKVLPEERSEASRMAKLHHHVSHRAMLKAPNTSSASVN